VDAAASSRASGVRTSDEAADGEAVWSWRPDAGVKSVTMPAHHANDVACVSHRRWWQQSPVTKESAEETVKTAAQGVPGDPVNL